MKGCWDGGMHVLGLFVRAEEQGKQVGMTLGQKGPVHSVIRPGPLRGLMLKAEPLGRCGALCHH